MGNQPSEILRGLFVGVHVFLSCAPYSNIRKYFFKVKHRHGALTGCSGLCEEDKWRRSAGCRVAWGVTPCAAKENLAFQGKEGMAASSVSHPEFGSLTP